MTGAETITYRCEGGVRGRCGTAHRSLDTAERHCQRDHAQCRALPGGNSYSDRRVVAYADGELMPTVHEHELAEHVTDVEEGR